MTVVLFPWSRRRYEVTRCAKTLARVHGDVATRFSRAEMAGLQQSLVFVGASDEEISRQALLFTAAVQEELCRSHAEPGSDCGDAA